MDEGECPLPFFVNGFAGIVSKSKKDFDRHQDKNRRTKFDLPTEKGLTHVSPLIDKKKAILTDCLLLLT